MNTNKLKEHGNIDSSIEYFLDLNIPLNAKILDVGCNFGSTLFRLHELGYTNIQGIDNNDKSIEIGKRTYSDIQNRITYYPGNTIPYEDEDYDIVLMFDVIEHIPDIQEFLTNQVYRVLKRGGRFIFQTPNKIINIPWEIINKRSFSAYKIYHCSLQTKKSLRTVLESAQFKDISIEKYNIVTDHNKKKVKRKVGYIGLPLLYILQGMPLFLFPNLWGTCRK
ncbi:MAG: class I SAM-dependent methyltransferase [Anaerolineales bacterium]|nr:class I SAM-dependent methyltransferase [Anaerolineales bacterium]